MSLKSLLSSRSLSSRLTHPNAKYDSSARLSCSLCATPIKHENLWSSHLVSKGHRSKAAAAAKEEEKRASKRVKVDAETAAPSATEEQDEEDTSASALPDDFYEDKSQQPARAVAQNEDVEMSAPTTVEPVVAPVVDDEDDEWASFEASLAPAASFPTPASNSTNGAKQVSATMRAAPVLYEFGAPAVLQEGEQAVEAEDEAEEETEEEKRERESREEREEMMERMDKEVRDQEEVDMRVVVS